MTRAFDRRQLLSWTALGTVGVTLPSWWACSARRGGSFGAWERAKDGGRPLLIVIVPKNEEQHYTVGTAWGELLNHGSDELLADLALCEVACAPLSEVRQAMRDVRGLPFEDTTAILVEPDGEAWPVRVDLEAPHDIGNPESYEPAIRARMARFEQALHRVIAPDERALERRAEDAARALPSSTVERVERSIEAGVVPDSDIEAAPALVRLAAESDPASRATWIALLAAAAIRAVRDAPPEGAAWASSWGCGISIEGHPEANSGIACGMAFTPQLSHRFLHFWTEEA